MTYNFDSKFNEPIKFRIDDYKININEDVFTRATSVILTLFDLFF